MSNEHDLHDYRQLTMKQPKANDIQKSLVNKRQVGGDHYKKHGDLQPWDVIVAWNLGYLDGTALKYIARWRDKGGINDIKKAIHFLEKFIEVEEGKNNGNV